MLQFEWCSCGAVHILTQALPYDNDIISCIHLTTSCRTCRVDSVVRVLSISLRTRRNDRDYHRSEEIFCDQSSCRPANAIIPSYLRFSLVPSISCITRACSFVRGMSRIYCYRGTARTSMYSYLLGFVAPNARSCSVTSCVQTRVMRERVLAGMSVSPKRLRLLSLHCPARSRRAAVATFRLGGEV